MSGRASTLVRPGQIRAGPTAGADVLCTPRPITETRSVVAVALGVAGLGLAALLLRRAALVAAAAAVVVVPVVGGRAELEEIAVTHQMCPLGGRKQPSPVGEAEVTLGSQLKNDLCVS